MVYSANTEIYNTIFVNNYDKLLKFCVYNEDRLQDTYVDIHDRLNRITFTAHTSTLLESKLIAYTKTCLFNDWKTDERLKKKNIAPEDCNFELEEKLLKEQNLNDDNLNHQQQLEYVSQKLFEYIKKNYGVEYEYVFVTYYLYDANNRKITYAQLSKITGYSISKCCKIIQTIKDDLRLNLINYINE